LFFVLGSWFFVIFSTKYIQVADREGLVEPITCIVLPPDDLIHSVVLFCIIIQKTDTICIWLNTRHFFN